MGRVIFPLGRSLAMAAAAMLLSPVARGQGAASPDRAGKTAPAWWKTHFDLATLLPPEAADRDTVAGGDVDLAPAMIAGVGATDRQRGATAITDKVAYLFQRQAELSGRVGLSVGSHGLLFGRVGYSEFDIGEAFSRFGARAFSTGGVLVGAGAEARVSPSLSFKTEVHSVEYRSDLSDRQLLGGLAWRY
jgi:hypothetical protein